MLQKHIFKGFSPLEPRLHNTMNVSCRELSMFFNNQNPYRPTSPCFVSKLSMSGLKTVTTVCDLFNFNTQNFPRPLKTLNDAAKKIAGVEMRTRLTQKVICPVALPLCSLVTNNSWEFSRFNHCKVPGRLKSKLKKTSREVISIHSDRHFVCR